jgi:hypothetical protein
MDSAIPRQYTISVGVSERMTYWMCQVCAKDFEGSVWDHYDQVTHEVKCEECKNGPDNLNNDSSMVRSADTGSSEQSSSTGDSDVPDTLNGVC